MRFGVCGPIEWAENIAAAGYDYIELSAAADLVPDDDEAAWQAKRPSDRPGAGARGKRARPIQ